MRQRLVDLVARRISFWTDALVPVALASASLHVPHCSRTRGSDSVYERSTSRLTIT